MGNVKLRMQTSAGLQSRPAPATEIVNAFPIIVEDGATLAYRVWAIDPIPATPELREKIRGHLWQYGLKRPVSRTRLDGAFAYAVALSADEQEIEYVGAGGKLFRIGPTDVVRRVALSAPADDDEVDFAAAMLQSGFAIHLRQDRDLFRGHWPDRFYLSAADRPWRPEQDQRTFTPNLARQRSGGPLVDIFRGFRFKVIHLGGVGFCLVVDVLTTYVGARTLQEYQALGQGIPDSLLRGDALTRWVNDYGYLRQSVYLVRLERNRTIGNTSLYDGTVYTYLQGRGEYVRRRITEHDQAATIIYKADDLRNEDKHYTASVALLKPIFTTEAAEVRQLEDVPAFPPGERLARIKRAIRHLRGAQVEGLQLGLGDPLRQTAGCLTLPSLAFGPSGRPTVVLPPADSAAMDPGARRRWNEEKMTAVRKHGPFRVGLLGTPYLVYPADLEREGLLERFVDETKDQLRVLGHDSSEFELAPYEDTTRAKGIITKVIAIESAGQASFILLGLPAHGQTAENVYAGIKTRLKLPSKCFSSSKLRYVARDPRRFTSYVQRNTLGVVIENGAAPWGLAQPLVYELQFGFDVARMERSSFMGAVAIADRAGSDPYFGYADIASGDRIPTNVIVKFILDRLERFRAAEGRAPRSILFQRKGRLMDTEARGMSLALDKYAARHPNDARPAWAIVAIEKTASTPLRMFLEEGANQVGRSFSGSYHLQSPRVGYLVTAGAPSLRVGTPRPLRITVEAWGPGPDAPDIVAILQDLFWLSQLSWSAPEVDARLPLTLRFTAQKLGRFVLEYDDEDDVGEWEGEPDHQRSDEELSPDVNVA
ncbi:MAG: hypothetical protein M3082_16885 [Candidatus Dormibacteraeota bacterium]|nr:hypothetical protein [Thermoproteota archaeon]MDQ6879332.1 hypothetical protein [Candidatus Dormibacteraeota bacterium]